VAHAAPTPSLFGLQPSKESRFLLGCCGLFPCMGKRALRVRAETACSHCSASASLGRPGKARELAIDDRSSIFVFGWAGAASSTTVAWSQRQDVTRLVTVAPARALTGRRAPAPHRDGPTARRRGHLNTTTSSASAPPGAAPGVEERPGGDAHRAPCRELVEDRGEDDDQGRARGDGAPAPRRVRRVRARVASEPPTG
jgi:hypothetical protein